MLKFSLGGAKFARYTRVPRTPYSHFTHSSHPEDFTCWVDPTMRLIVVGALYVAIYGRFIKENIVKYLLKSCTFFENRIER